MRRELDSTRPNARPTRRNPRIHLLADVWLLTIIAIVVATGIPWFTSGLEVDVGTATWGVLAIGGIQVALTVLASPSPPDGSWRDRALTLLDVAGVILMGFVWEHVGALQNPMFLTIFGLPVLGAIFISRWHPFLIAVVSIVVVGIAVVSEAPELRWYAVRLFGEGGWLRGLLHEGAAPRPSFSGFYAPPSYLVVLLEVFAIALIGCALAAEYLGTIFERVNARSILAREEAERAQELWATLIERLPLPALLIDVDTRQVIGASQLAAHYLQVEGSVEGRRLFDVLKVSYPEIVDDLIDGAVSASAAPVTVIRVADQVRLTRLRSTQLRALHLAHAGRRLTFLTIEDITEAFCLKAALDTSEHAAVVVDARGRVLAFNEHLIGLFGRVEVGADVTQWLPQAGPDLRWWEPGLVGRRKMHIEIGSRVYLLTSSVIPLAGEEDRISSVTFLPIAKAGTTDPPGSSTTVLTRTMRQAR